MNKKDLKQIKGVLEEVIVEFFGQFSRNNKNNLPDLYEFIQEREQKKH